MKRALLLTLGVLLPFALLIALGFSSLRDRPHPSLPESTSAPAPEKTVSAPAGKPPNASPPEPAAAVVTDAATVDVPDPSGSEAETPEEARHRPILSSVRPLVIQCFSDLGTRLHTTQTVTVTFDTTDAGTFTNAAVTHLSWQDPELTACIIDAFEDAQFQPTSEPLRGHSHTFTFSPALKRR